MKKYEKLLERLGLNEVERIIYITLLEHPYLTITEVAKHTKYHRPAIYKGLASLISSGYVEKSYLDGKRYHYHAANPEKLREKLIELTTIADHLLPEMTALYEKHHDAPILSISEGVEGIRNIHDDVVDTLRSGGVYYCYSSSKDGGEKGGIYTSDRYHKKQKQKEISRHVITNSREDIENTSDPYREIVAIPKTFDSFDDDITKIIYANKVAIIDYNSQMGWVIENERFARYEEKIFRLLGKMLKKSL